MLKNITLSAEESLIREGRNKAGKERSTLNEKFRIWLGNYVESGKRGDRFDILMDSLAYTDPGKKFFRDELNER